MGLTVGTANLAATISATYCSWHLHSVLSRLRASRTQETIESYHDEFGTSYFGNCHLSPINKSEFVRLFWFLIRRVQQFVGRFLGPMSTLNVIFTPACFLLYFFLLFYYLNGMNLLYRRVLFDNFYIMGVTILLIFSKKCSIKE